MRPKHGLVLDSNLHWKRATECSGNGPGFALGLEMGDALNVASWASFDGVIRRRLHVLILKKVLVDRFCFGRQTFLIKSLFLP